MGRCTGRRCPMQVGYDVANCNQFDCIYRTEINTNYDRIKSMNVEEMAKMLLEETEAPLSWETYYRTPDGALYNREQENAKIKAINHIKQWLLQEVSNERI